MLSGSEIEATDRISGHVIGYVNRLNLKLRVLMPGFDAVFF
jgi:hypothetical protein